MGVVLSSMGMMLTSDELILSAMGMMLTSDGFRAVGASLGEERDAAVEAVRLICMRLELLVSQTALAVCADEALAVPWPVTVQQSPALDHLSHTNVTSWAMQRTEQTG